MPSRSGQTTNKLTRTQRRAIVRVVNEALAYRTVDPKLHEALFRLINSFPELCILYNDMLYSGVVSRMDGTIGVTKPFRQDPCRKCDWFLNHDPLCGKKRS